jgi:3-deoxy-D-manno-octulosonate 8-phosphate phosphatase (KDO 8-P phosphatase)
MIFVQPHLVIKARRIKLLLTDCDGVLTDAGVYYSAEGEQLKRFSIRDGMGVERLRELAMVETGIMTGETSGSVAKRAEKLRLQHLYLGIKDKAAKLREIMQVTHLQAAEIAFIGDDVNDLGIIRQVGLSACPADAMIEIRRVADFTCTLSGGHGAFREFAELILAAKMIDYPDTISSK